MKNISKISFYLISLLALSACKHSNDYKISGHIKNGNHSKVYLEDIFDNTPVIIDTTTILNETFNLKNYAIKGIYRLRFGEDANSSVFLYIEDKGNIKISANLKSLDQYKIEGSKASTSIQQLMMISKKNFASLNSIITQLGNASSKTKDSLQTLFEFGKKNHVDYIKKFVEKEPNNDVACFALNFLGPMMQEEIPYLVSITEKLHTADPNSKYITASFQQFQQYRDQLMEEAESGIALNTQAPNIILQSPNADTIQLKNLQGSYVLLDFWASWCQPCRMENPNVVALYNKYHTQGFEVFSVSLDANADQWKKAIAKDHLAWKNHGCDFSGWNSIPAQVYKVKSIPCTFLLDKTGKIIAKNLRGNELSTKLAELFPAEK